LHAAVQAIKAMLLPVWKNAENLSLKAFLYQDYYSATIGKIQIHFVKLRHVKLRNQLLQPGYEGMAAYTELIPLPCETEYPAQSVFLKIRSEQFIEIDL
jgi:hypothetical protein